MRIIGLLLVLFIFVFSQTTKAQSTPVYKNSKAPIDNRVDDLLSRMTLEEKIYQLNQYTVGINTNVNNKGEEIKFIPAEIGSLIYFDDNALLRNDIQKKAMLNSRLGIPILFGFDVIHGFRTLYPIPLGQACSWNTDLVKQACAMAAQESRMSGVDWTFSPMIDIARDGRWGRISEGYGEDSYTNAMFCVASVKGYQSDDLSDPKTVAACLKHYVGYGVSEGGRDYTATDISRQALWDTYLVPYEAGVKAGAATIMSSFNDISGVPATANHYMLTEILRNRWNFNGFVVSDWDAVQQLIPQGVAATRKEAALKAFMAGTDMDMKDNCYHDHMAELVAEGKIPVEKIDQSVKRVLRLKFELGLFENPYTPVYQDDERILLPKNIQIAQKMTEESIVLLKNDNTLPLKVSKIAVVGPMAKDKDNIIGSWIGQGRAADAESIYEGLEQEFKGKSELLYAKGCDFDGNDQSGYTEAISIAQKSDVVVVCLGEKSGWSGENASRSTLALPAIQENLVKELKKTGKPIVLILSNGRPLELCRIEQDCNAIVEIWQPGIAGGTPLAGILSGRTNPSGKLAVTFPLTTGQIPIYYNHRQSSRPDQGMYQDISNLPLYEFGHGLSYTTFTYGKLKVSKEQINKGEQLTAEIAVTNNGDKDGYETVHWFISDPYCSITRPVKELKHFEKRMIKKGETIIFRFDIEPDRDFSFIDDNGNKFIEAGEFNVIVKDQKVELSLTESYIVQ